ncbi:MAG TPA: heme exporter protein CcmD [Afipia sp.]
MSFLTSLGPYASFIVGSYALVAFVVLALIAWIAADQQRQQNALRELEERGMTRRSAAKAGDK